ncbi:MAG: S8/S53 family peptidase [Bacteroidales bacterium]|nr:S8/S53 family peptidase [Bacteroidales bacterium]
MKHFVRILLIASLLFCSCKPRVKVGTVQFTENGVTYEEEAVLGKLMLIFQDNIDEETALAQIEQGGGKVEFSLPHIQYYLVRVKRGHEDEFMQNQRLFGSLQYMYPLVVLSPQAASSVVLDNYQKKYPRYDNQTHGQVVAKLLSSSLDGGEVIDVDAALTSDQELSIYDKDVTEKMDQILTTAEGPVIINMSLGPTETESLHWKDLSAYLRDNYRNRYHNFIRGLINYYGKYDGKVDFVIVLAAGNKGIDQFEKNILEAFTTNSGLGVFRIKLSKKELEIFEKHFIFVTATDRRDGSYSNRLSEGVSHPWVTDVDISNLYAENGEPLTGTSCAAPLAAAYLSNVINKHDISAAEALEYLRLATKNAEDHTLRWDDLDKTVETGKKLGMKKPDFYYVSEIPYSQGLFIDGATGVIPLPNGDRMHYEYYRDMSFVPMYGIKFTLEGGKEIKDHYGVLLVDQIPDGYVFSAKPSDDNWTDERCLDALISIFRFGELNSDRLMLIVSKK